MSALSTQFNDFILPATPIRPRSRGWFSRVISALQDAQMRNAEREIARMIEVRGGRITDDLERQIERRFV